MLFWLFLLFLLIVFPNRKKKLSLFFFLLVGSISSIRYDIGYDYMNYVNLIKGDYQYDIVYERIEPLPKFLIQLSSYVDCTQIFFIITSVTIIGLTTLFINKESLDVKMSILVFMGIPLFFWNSLSIVRQMMACSFALMIYYNYYNRKYINAFVFLFLAVLSHNSAWILLLILVANRIHFKRKWYVVSIIGSFFLSEIVSYLIVNYSFGLLFHATVFIERASELKGNQKMIILFNLIFIFLTIIASPRIMQDTKIRYYYNIVFIGQIIYNVLSPAAVLAGRLSIYFTLPLIVLLPNIFYYSGIRLRMVKTCMSILFVILYIYTINLATTSFVAKITDKDPYCPYKTVLFND